jgi:SAM-dependent MidA family methyltransferase
MTLDQRIRSEIEIGGPMPFERFMDLALYDPQSGFFTGGRLRSERSGDFLTSPEVSALFGETLARYVSDEQERIGEPFEVVEVAAGSGSLIGPLLRAVDVPAFVVEASPAARTVLGDVVAPDRVLTDLPDRIRGVVIGNELIDNLPMALAERVAGAWRERWVGLDDDGLAMVDAPARTEVAEWLDEFAGDVSDGGWVEAQLVAGAWVRMVLERLEAGSLLLFDYGDTAENLIPRRQDGTLRTYRAHHLGPHPLDEPGETDITADVNFTALAAAAESAGSVVEIHRQDDFLIALGLGDRLSELRHAELAAARSGDEMERLRLRTLKMEAETLLHPRGLGDFRVLIARR